MGLFQSLETGKRALLAHQMSLTTIGQNIANVDTPGYTRQRARLASTDPLNTSLGAIGTGVNVVDVRHTRDLFLSAQLRQEAKSLGQWSYREKILGQVETMFNEPSDEALRGHLDDFWNSWSQLANAPDSRTSRNDVLAKANILVNDFHQLSGQLNTLKASINDDLAVRVKEVNQYGAEIADLNRQITRVELDGSHANDLRDRRDLLIDRLSPLVDVNVTEDKTGARVYIGAVVIVDGANYYPIATDRKFVNGAFKSDVVLAGSKSPVKNANGELFGLLEARDKVIPTYLDRLDTLARTIAERVNSVHVTGYGLRPGGGGPAPTGTNFFMTSSVSAASIAIDGGVQNDPSLIAASQTGEPGDAAIALTISGLRSARVMSGGSLTFGESYASLVGDVGVDTRQASNYKDTSSLVSHQLENARQSVQGVSLDEEMTNLIRSQHAYDAAARIITTIDQAFTTVISGMGVVGR